MKYTIKEIKQLNRLGQRAVFGQELLECAKSIDNIIAMSGDLGNSSGLDRFKRSIPERFYNVGIAGKTWLVLLLASLNMDSMSLQQVLHHL